MANEDPYMTPYLGEIRIFGGDFPPQGFALCDGKMLKPADFPALFSLISNWYGGDGVTTFALPDLRRRVPIHIGAGHYLGRNGGQESVTLVWDELPRHTHIVNADSAGGQLSPAGNYWGHCDKSIYAQPSANDSLAMDTGSVSTYGKGAAHENRIPYTVVNYIIAIDGIYPSAE